MSSITSLPVRRGAPPLEYNQETAERICDALAAGSAPLSVMLKARGDLPCWATVMRWEAEMPSFSEALKRARIINLHHMAESLISMADDAIEAPQKVQGYKLAIGTRQWHLAKLMPETYGDKLDLTSKGEALAAPAHQIDARIQSIVLTAQRRAAGAEEDIGLEEKALRLLE